MEWWATLLLIFVSLLVLMASGMPIAFCFLLISLVGVFLLQHGTVGWGEMPFSIFQSVNTFLLLPVPLFILMGEITFHTGIATRVLDVMDEWLGRFPGRLSFLTVGAGTAFAALTGSSLASTAMLGSLLLPEMEKRGYKKPMSLGPILGSGGLAIMIPPTSLAVLLAAIAEVSIGKVLMGIIMPGLLMATNYSIYIFGRCVLQPDLAPIYNVPAVPLSKKLGDVVRYVLPTGFIIFLVIGLIMLGIATPSESAATGVVGSFIVGAAYGGLNWGVVKKTIASTLHISVMLLMIIVGATAFGQILAFSGVSRNLVAFATGLPVAPIFILISMQVLLLILGCFMEVVSIMMITTPLFMPIVYALGFEPVWFIVIYLLNMEMATTTPPFGMSLFVMKGVAPPGTTMGDCIRGAVPFLLCDTVSMALIMIFPQIALWLPGLMD